MDDFYGINDSNYFAFDIPAFIFLGSITFSVDIICLCNELGVIFPD